MKIFGIHIQTVETIPGEVIMKRMPLRYARSVKYLRKEDQLRCLGAGYLMYSVLGISEDELQYGEYGKPFVPGGPEFSLSHGGNWAILCVSDQVVGVDIEPMKAANLDIARQVFTTSEQCWLRQCPLERFHILWTIKESIMKATGLGMQLEPATFSVLPAGGPNHINGKPWHTAWMLYDGCAIACASPKPIDNLEFEEIFYEKDG